MAESEKEQRHYGTAGVSNPRSLLDAEKDNVDVRVVQTF